MCERFAEIYKVGPQDRKAEFILCAIHAEYGFSLSDSLIRIW